ESVVDFFSQESHRDLIQQLKNAGLQIEIEVIEVEQEGSNLAEKTFVISGVFNTFSRDELKEKIKLNGGKVVSSISAKLDYLVAG
ncbi:MAG: NAD-dependent DNA ligase LigA, partial [Roseivirga sp.]|nr:NAD-dependent DNA ligase LigA [Roseivirga sp.]